MGGCANRSGTDDGTDTGARADRAASGSAAANHEVVGKTTSHQQCVRDVDATDDEATTSGSGEAAAPCLAVDRVPGDCCVISGPYPCAVRILAVCPAGPVTS